MQPHYRKPLNRTALLGVLVLVALLVATGAAWAQIPLCESVTMVPFECTDTAYLSQGLPTETSKLNTIDLSMTPFMVDLVADTGVDEINAIGYNDTDNYLYGVQIDLDVASPWTNQGIVRIDKNGQVCSLGDPSPTDGSTWPDHGFNAGDVIPGTNTMIVHLNGTNAGTGRVYIIDLATMTFTSKAYSGPPQTPTAPPGRNVVLDWAAHPTNGLLYGVARDGAIAVLNLTGANAVRTDYPSNAGGFPGLDRILPGQDGYGAAYFNNAGEFFVYQNNNYPADPAFGTIYKIDLGSNPAAPNVENGAKVVSTQTGPESTRNDGAACTAPEPDNPAIDIEKTVCLGEYNTDCSFGDGSEFVEAMNGEAVTYFFEITNNGDLALDPVDFSDMDLGIDFTTVGLVVVLDERDNGSLAPGDKIVLAYQTTADENLAPQGSLVNTACTQGTDPDQTVVGDCDPAIVLVPELCEDPGDPSDGYGCTPGYWKAKQHYDSWPSPYTPASNFLVVFGSGPDITFKEALKIRDPRGEGALIRHAVAALLNAASGYVDYEFTVDEVIQWVQDAYTDGTYEEFEKAKDHLEMENERMCPLSNDTFAQ